MLFFLYLGMTKYTIFAILSHICDRPFIKGKRLTGCSSALSSSGTEPDSSQSLLKEKTASFFHIGRKLHDSFFCVSDCNVGTFQQLFSWLSGNTEHNCASLFSLLLSVDSDWTEGYAESGRLC